MALHLLESLEATEQDWLSAFNSSSITQCIKSWDLDVWKLLAKVFVMREEINPRFIDLAKRYFNQLNDSKQTSFLKELFSSFTDELSLVALELLETGSHSALEALFRREGLKHVRDELWPKLAQAKLKFEKAKAVQLLNQLQGSEEDWHVVLNSSAINYCIRSWDIVVGELISTFVKLAKYNFDKQSTFDQSDLLESIFDNFITELSLVAQEILCTCQDKHLSLYRITDISDDAVEILSKHLGSLALPSLKGLTDSAVEVLSNRKGDLYLPGLLTLSDIAAESLIKHQGYLDLRGLECISDAVAKSLSQHQGYIDLTGLKVYSDYAAERLCKIAHLKKRQRKLHSYKDQEI
jgi:hypothetical protein